MLKEDAMYFETAEDVSAPVLEISEVKRLLKGLLGTVAVFSV